MERKVYIWLMIVVIFILSILCGYFIAKSINLNDKIRAEEKEIDNDISPEEIKKLEAAKVVDSKEEKIGANTQVVLKTSYSLCGHEEEKIEDKSNVINLKKEELAKIYTGWNITNFSSDEVELEREVDGICGEHYIITEENGFVVVYKKSVNETTGKVGKEEFITTDISVEYLPQEDLDNIKSGEEIYGKENLNRFLEDYE